MPDQQELVVLEGVRQEGLEVRVPEEETSEVHMLIVEE